ncbi:LysR family transcriptional regulator [Exiguobacterium flavidum]|uniref:LysR family transcriptional regulator n=1 Tax=Exiguobacterium flavidum TaxID=2184695 RepID=UPI000DF84B2C|nr:LysR family transcriptional regulator [Exiguobacterium flavidum]
MEIRQINYFLAVVENGYNLSRASRHLHVSQPALSQMIREFEESERVELFRRKNGRLVGLTDAGSQFYEDARQVMTMHSLMMRHIREETQLIRGKVRLGIPPVILPALFSTLIPKLMREHPGIDLEIVEEGAYELKKRLLAEELDLAVLIEPEKVFGLEQHRLVADEVVVAVRPTHPLAKGKTVTWKALAEQPLVILNDSFMLHHQILNHFRKAEIDPRIFFTSGAWDLLIGMVQELDVVSILPEPILTFHHAEDICILPFEPPMTWDVSLCHVEHIHHRPVVQYVEEYILDFFHTFWPN